MSTLRSLLARPVGLLCSALAVVWLLAACAPGGELVRSGKELIEQGKAEEGLSQIDKALALDPGNTEYRLLAMRQREVPCASHQASGVASTSRTTVVVKASLSVSAIAPRSCGLTGIHAKAKRMRHGVKFIYMRVKPLTLATGI